MQRSRRSPVNVALFLFCIALTGCSSSTGGTSTATPTTASAAAVPAAYQSLYAGLQQGLTSFNTYLGTVAPSGSGSAPIFGAHLLVANANRGPALLQPGQVAAAGLFLDRFNELGIQGVTLSISFPILLPSFPQSANYLAFYERVAQAVRQHGMKLAVEENVIFSNTPFSPFHYDFSGLTLASYEAGQQQMAQTIIDHLAPDYLAIMTEPDTYAHLTGLTAIDDPATATSIVNAVLNGLQRGHTLIGAGAGSWSDIAFAQSLAANTNIDYLDTHVYPFAQSTIQRVFQIAALARQYHKQFVIDEAWLWKDLTATVSAANSTQIMGRDLYSFWQPLDSAFLQDWVKFARLEGMAYFSPFSTNYLFAYVSYTPALEENSYQANQQLFDQTLSANVQADIFTPTGRAYQQAIAQSGP
jgi:hypothetical protein